MSSVETYYLIDFENVHEDGLSGSEKLGSHDHVHLFSTKNAPKISFEKLTTFNSSDLYSHEVPVGDQSLDMHLVSYLGYLIGTNTDSKCRYVIISKDTGYDNIISFWKNQEAVSVTRQEKISSAQNTIKTSGTPSQSNKVTVSKRKVQLNAEVQREISNAKYPQSTINGVASIVVKHYGEDSFAMNVYNELRESYAEYVDLYKLVIPIIIRYSIPITEPPKSAKNHQEVQKILSKAGFGSDTISYADSLISKYGNEKNGKQTIYRSIVAKYGQKRGLNIYNHIKAIIH